MVPANKILTVTYGTFSCTLEGFEDPFSAMTEIAEYFRDLASKDRYFGAEPPTPDMDQLQRIAAAAMPGPVDAADDDGRIVLRPGTAESPLPASAVLSDVPEAAVPDAPGDDGEVASFVAAGEAASEDSAAAKLALLRGVADDGGFDPAEVERLFDEDTLSEGGAAAPDEAPEEDPAGPEVAAAPEPVMPVATDDLDADDATQRVVDEEPEVAATASEEASAAEQIEHAADSDAGAVANDVPAAAEAALADPSEREETEAVDEDEPAMADAAPEAPAPQDVPVEAAAVAETPETAEAAPGALDAEAAEPAAATANADDAPERVEDAEAPADSPSEEPLAPAIFDMIQKDHAETAEDAPAPDATVGDVHSEGMASALPPEAPEGDDSLTADLAALFSPRPAEDEADEAPAAQEVPKPRVTVRKVRKDAEAAPAEDAAPEAPAPAPEPEAPAALGDDEEADLMAELAAIEAELARDATGATAPSAPPRDDPADAEEADDLEAELAAIRGVVQDEAVPTAEAPPVAEPQTERPPEAAPVEDAVEAAREPQDLERLFAATDSRLSGEDASRRHANISHLKAAVAARKADSTIETGKADPSGAYREDLANTVKPRRDADASEEEAADEPKTEPRSAPLVLVSEQRVEPVSEAAPEVETALEAPETDIAAGLSKNLRAPDPGDDFEQFALDVGAVELPDVLEAAAVYSATVMGQESFSRPRLLHLAAEAVDDLSREEGLRGFGQLLRDGTIRKVGRGTFTLGTTSRFQRDAERRAG